MTTHKTDKTTVYEGSLLQNGRRVKHLESGELGRVRLASPQEQKGGIAFHVEWDNEHTDSYRKGEDTPFTRVDEEPKHRRAHSE